MGCLALLPGDLPNPGYEPASPVSSALVGGFFTTMPPGKPIGFLGLLKRTSKRWLYTNTHIHTWLDYLAGPQARSPKSRYWQDPVPFEICRNPYWALPNFWWFSDFFHISQLLSVITARLRLHMVVSQCLLFSFPSQMSVSASTCPLFYKDTSHTGLVPTLLLYGLVLANHIYNDCSSKWGHILRAGLGLLHPFEGVTQFNQ